MAERLQHAAAGAANHHRRVIANRRSHPGFQDIGQFLAELARHDDSVEHYRRLVQKAASLLVRPQQLLDLSPQIGVVPAGLVEKGGSFLRRFDFQGGFKQRIQVGLSVKHPVLRPNDLPWSKISCTDQCEKRAQIPSTILSFFSGSPSRRRTNPRV
ncbi:MAG: hypothetical protein MUF25_11660 [Pirellulaceae bacterium]|nr:hypothetical protein [Pirellulaceae bacterium]